MGVALGGGKGSVAQKLLNGAQVHAGFQEMGGESVAQGVGVDSVNDRQLPHRPLQDAPQRAVGKPPPLKVHDERVPVLLVHLLPQLSPHRKVRPQGLFRFPAKGHDALLPPLAQDPHQTPGQVHIVEV
ncbi:hypothetical protein HRbin09_02004 [bacterium HR09]|nr:hypothetical protein HRbin09_02004 [bacterium HR09]